VKILDGPQAGATAVTDQYGNTQLSGPFDGGKALTIQASSGTLTTSAPFTPSGPGDKPWAPPLVFRAATDNIAIQLGDYDVTFDVGDGCRELPDDFRVRTYGASLSQIGATGYRVTLAGQFLDIGESTPPGTFDLSVFGHEFGIHNLDGDWLIPAWEKVTPTTSLAIWISGFPVTTAAGPTVSTFTLPVDKPTLDYCEVNVGGDLGSACAYPPFVRHVSCFSPNGRVIFKHR
jgi:hypothetical protein